MTQTSPSAASHAALARAETLTLPGVDALEGLAADIDKIVGEVQSAVEFVTKYGAYIPGAVGVLGPLVEFDKILGIVKSMLDHVPGADS